MKTRYSGLFITFEGIDGCGKTTQARRLYDYLRRRDLPVLFLREPGGTPVSERIRHILLDRSLQITPLAELLLYEAARAHLAETVILPELKRGSIIICDRYFDSTTAYQGFGRRLDRRLIGMLNGMASLKRPPDLTFIFDVDYETSLARRKKNADRLEKEPRMFFNRVRRGFKSLAVQRRVVLLDGRLEIEPLFGQVKEHALRLIRRRMPYAAD